MTYVYLRVKSCKLVKYDISSMKKILQCSSFLLDKLGKKKSSCYISKTIIFTFEQFFRI